jgi:hypothetical protein
MRRISATVFVFVPIYVEVAPTHAPEPAVVVSSQDRQSPPDLPPFWTWFIDYPRPISLNGQRK